MLCFHSVTTRRRVAIETGYRHIDTAYIYGNEVGVGKGLKHVLDNGTVKREDIFVVTKV
jgi:diketogulonate reductase-like aldo/keto reductase